MILFINYYLAHFAYFVQIYVKTHNPLRQDYAKMKLPKPRKRGDAYRIEIMIDGKRQSATTRTDIITAKPR